MQKYHPQLICQLNNPLQIQAIETQKLKDNLQETQKGSFPFALGQSNTFSRG